MARKSFEGVAAAFFSPSTVQPKPSPVAEPSVAPLQAAETVEAKPEGAEAAFMFYRAKNGAEAKTRRYTVLFKPSLFNRIAAAAAASKCSINDFINNHFEAALGEAV